MMQLTGTGVAMVTPFKDDFSVDTAGLTRLTHHLIDGGVEFLVILGTTGEAATLTAEEQALVIRTIMEANAGRVPNIIGAGGNNTLAVAAQLRHLDATYQADGYLSVSPYYNKPSQEGILRHYQHIAAATDKPIILYNVPGRTSSNVTAATTLAVAHSCPNIRAVKEASGNLEQGMEIVAGRPDGFKVLSGDDILTLGMVATGFDGVISVIGNTLPGPFSGMVRAALAGDFPKAKPIHYSLFTLMQLLFKEGNPAGVKAALKVQGICGDTVRMPLASASEGLYKAIEKEMQAFL